MTAKRNMTLAKPSQRLFALFSIYLRWYLRRHFHGLRISHAERMPRSVNGPLILYLNHPSWWDPLVGMMLARRFFPDAEHYAPIDETALERYGFFSKLGLFPVEINTARGAMQFLRYSRQILSTPNSMLWLTPEGHFSDPRQRPLVFKQGLATILDRAPSVTLLPLAIEYVFWDERLPEILVNCGTPIHTSDCDKYSLIERNASLSGALASTQDELAQLSITRDPAHFETVLAGGAGVGIFYDLWQRLRLASRGETYKPEHGGLRRP